MSKRHNSKDDARHRGRDEASRGRDRGAGRTSRGTSRREPSQSSSSTTQARSGDGRSQRRSTRREASGSVSRFQSFGPAAGMASMSMLCSEFTPPVAPILDSELAMRDREYCGICGEYREAPSLEEWWKRIHFEDSPDCLTAYREGKCPVERSDDQIKAEDAEGEAFREKINWVGPENTENPAQPHAPQTTDTSAWSQGASQPSAQPQIANPTYSDPQRNNLSTVYSPSAGYAAPTVQTGNTGYVPSSYASQPAPHYSGNTCYIPPGSMLPPPLPSHRSNTAYTSYTAPTRRIPTGLSPPGCTPATGYPLPPVHYTSSDIPYDTHQLAPYHPSINDPYPSEQYASTTSSARQVIGQHGSSHHGSSGHSHSHGSSGHGNHTKE
ncbi:uncharacterized protein EAF01_010742 [Botrytis porri]|uniref:Uncharacterized protein n=1 Tax=Botrytis porri TaxID=87229 RepID=A0A4Z1KQT6_9HELO|nr:uncharacterized protein EAF01_010742 [Botrytis porri]KAF7890933.1 hypothetical protein EAF01_010742 [Botrytis porri]TGO86434.1 hypothetical protein BPOR_0304g00080 [Botrytis porri]